MPCSAPEITFARYPALLAPTLRIGPLVARELKRRVVDEHTVLLADRHPWSAIRIQVGLFSDVDPDQGSGLTAASELDTAGATGAVVLALDLDPSDIVKPGSRSPSEGVERTPTVALECS